MHFPISTLLLLPTFTTATLLASLNGSSPIHSLGECQLEGQNHGDPIKCDQTTGLGNSSIYIKPNSVDPSGRACLHYHRDAHFRRAEVKAAGTYTQNANYYAGFTFMLPHSHKSLVLWQWKKADGTAKPVQNVPMNLEFDQHGNLTLGYTGPDQKGKTALFAVPVKMGVTHSVAIAWDTYEPKSGKRGLGDLRVMGRAQSGGTKDGTVTMYWDGEKLGDKSGLTLWTGDCYPKFGNYRGEDDGAYNDGNNPDNVFDYYLYAAAVSDASLDEVAEAGGLSK